jgi:hemin uptake protein HemP
MIIIIIMTYSKPDTARLQNSDTKEATQAIRATSAQLLGQAKELLIDHAGETYRLRITRSGKLILTK